MTASDWDVKCLLMGTGFFSRVIKMHGWSGVSKKRRRETSWKTVSVVEAREDGGLCWREESSSSGSQLDGPHTAIL